MSEERKGKTPNGISRREFLKDAGLVVGGATIGSVALANACGNTVTSTITSTTTATKTQGTSTVTVTTPGNTITTTVPGTGAFTDPVDGTTWPTLAALQAHFNAVHPNGDALISAFTVNGTTYAFQVKPYWSLAHVLREGLGLFALKEGCNLGECGACTVIVDGQPVFSCLMLACEMEGRSVTTLEGLAFNGALSPIQQKWYDNEAQQCGFCTPGFIMAAQALISKNAKPTLADVQLALSGHSCMCGNVHRQVNVVVGGVS